MRLNRTITTATQNLALIRSRVRLLASQLGSPPLVTGLMTEELLNWQISQGLVQVAKEGGSFVLERWHKPSQVKNKLLMFQERMMVVAK